MKFVPLKGSPPMPTHRVWPRPTAEVWWTASCESARPRDHSDAALLVDVAGHDAYL